MPDGVCCRRRVEMCEVEDGGLRCRVAEERRPQLGRLGGPPIVDVFKDALPVTVSTVDECSASNGMPLVIEDVQGLDRSSHSERIVNLKGWWVVRIRACRRSAKLLHLPL